VEKVGAGFLSLSHLPAAEVSLAGYVALANRGKAEKFELYLKSGTGRSFAKKHS
jgi:hypothetical protein